MPLQGLTREQIDTAIGYNLMGSQFVSSTTTSAGDTTSILDNLLRGPTDYHNGRWALITSGAGDGEITWVDDDNGAGDLTVSPAITSVGSGVTYQLWKAEYPPRMVHEFTNQAITRASRRVYDPEEDQSLHFDGKTARFDIPTEFDMLQDVQYRASVRSLEIHSCDMVFDETTDTGFTQTADTEDKKRGNASLKIDVVAGATAAAGDAIADSITSADISSYTHLEGWVKCSRTLAAGDWRIHLDDATITAATILASTILEVLTLPAVSTANVWQFFSIALGNPRSDTAIISVGLEYVTDPDTGYTIWFDDLHVVEQDTAVYHKLKVSISRMGTRLERSSSIVPSPQGLFLDHVPGCLSLRRSRSHPHQI